MKLTTLAIALVCLTAVKVSAEGCWDCEPEPPVVVEPPGIVLDPPVSITRLIPDGDSDHHPYSRIYYAICTCDEMKVAWGFESLELRTNKARMQCEQRRERIQCPMKWK